MPMLHDLDELTLQVRSPEIRSYLAESVRALRANAPRAAILSLWVAVNSDIIEKIRELASGGDQQAIDDAFQLDAWIATDNVVALQRFEGTILKLAQDKYEFLSTLEFADLDRLRQDRHRCAHPAFTADGDLYQPSPEQVRAYMVAAVQSLFTHPPVQGRSAMRRLQGDVTGQAFPQEAHLVAAYLGPKYVDHGKENLVANIVALFLKEALTETPNVDRPRSLHVLAAVNQRRYPVYWKVMERRFPELVAQATEAQLENVLAVLAADLDTWKLLPESEQVRLQAFVSQATPLQSTSVLLISIGVPRLKALALVRLRSFSGDDLSPFLIEHPSREFVQIAVARLEGAKTFREAWQFLDAVQAMLPFLSESDLRRVITAARTNDQIYSSGNTQRRLTTLLRTTAFQPSPLQSDWVELAQAHPGMISIHSELRMLGWLPEEVES